ncbi:anaerobic ribonucleoside-triphosphate reductase activating protein [Corynebacterium renale]|uniref:Ribonucleoside-triphosphate reductase class III activase subunit n=1 Tax=Corynebacterium renale TaxID=1724 RepID=A0A2A9DN29_9CORY|nr:anaerobic ribonucleoside-triphosphate reductase activating protein [Corynebacterium renale]PFG28147.1 ribonucleoside-triphosphate reductase class III activase subunit [Corynebacterium renale]SQG65262.1 anaerobic ribonucleoside-triphosphate reductase activating protein [Corynebacterium renale]SQI20374.1 anaerobic ribonucleoside-triphosphate reductase activating protein [Corynebacterium renale]STC98539.1 anaerobic ribonucleoside-triphosphate reductase activating protein [Corynebacterium renale
MSSTCDLDVHRRFRAPHTPPERLATIARTDDRSRTWAQTPEFMVADYKPFQVLDGEGVRCSLYVSYCPFNCLDCYNKAAQKRSYGTPYTPGLEERIMADLGRNHVAGLTLVGGEPMLSARHLLPLVRRIRRELPGKTVWAYTGYLWETLQLFTDERRELLGELDVLIDGPYIAEERDPGNPRPFVGSANQRVLDVQESLAAGEAVEYGV